MPGGLCPHSEAPTPVACRQQVRVAPEAFAYGNVEQSIIIRLTASVGELLLKLSVGLLIFPPLITTMRIACHIYYGVPPEDLVGCFLGVLFQWLLFIFPILTKPIDGTLQLAYLFLIFLSFVSMLLWPLSQPQIHRWEGTMEGSVGLLSFPFLYLGLRRLTPHPVRRPIATQPQDVNV